MTQQSIMMRDKRSSASKIPLMSVNFKNNIGGGAKAPNGSVPQQGKNVSGQPQ